MNWAFPKYMVAKKYWRPEGNNKSGSIFFRKFCFQKIRWHQQPPWKGLNGLEQRVAKPRPYNPQL